MSRRRFVVDEVPTPETDETKVLYCWRLHKLGLDKPAIIAGLNRYKFFDSEASDVGSNIYQTFLTEGLDALERSEKHYSRRTRYSFVIAVSKYLHISREQSETWVQLYEKTRRNKKVWPKEKT